MAWRGLNAGSCSPLPLLVYPQSRLLKRSSACRRFYQAGLLDDREGRQVRRAPLPNLGVTFIGEMCATSWEGITLRHRSYWLIRRSRWALSSFGFRPRSESPCRLLPVPAAHGSFPTLSPTVLG